MSLLKQMDHSEYQEGLKLKSDESLRFIAKDAREASEALPNGINAGYYADESLYCQAELNRRERARNAASFGPFERESVAAIIALANKPLTWSDVFTVLQSMVKLADFDGKPGPRLSLEAIADSAWRELPARFRI